MSSRRVFNRKVGKAVVQVALLAFTLAFLSCASLSDNYRQSDITVATHPGMVEGRSFIGGWTTEAGVVWSAQNVGIMAANDLANKGYRSLWVLVELVSQGGSASKYYTTPNIWQISAYRK